MYDVDSEDIDEYERPNKSQMKRDAQARLFLVEQIVTLSESQWAGLGLSDILLSELKELTGIRQNGARNRQMKRVAKLLKEEDTSEATRVVESEKRTHDNEKAAFHKVELCRDNLLSNDAETQKHSMSRIILEYDMVDMQLLNQLVRNAKGDKIEGKPSKASKLLFKYLRELML